MVDYSWTGLRQITVVFVAAGRTGRKPRVSGKSRCYVGVGLLRRSIGYEGVAEVSDSVNSCSIPITRGMRYHPRCSMGGGGLNSHPEWMVLIQRAVSRGVVVSEGGISVQSNEDDDGGWRGGDFGAQFVGYRASLHPRGAGHSLRVTPVAPTPTNPVHAALIRDITDHLLSPTRAEERE